MVASKDWCCGDRVIEIPAIKLVGGGVSQGSFGLESCLELGKLQLR